MKLLRSILAGAAVLLAVGAVAVTASNLQPSTPTQSATEENEAVRVVKPGETIPSNPSKPIVIDFNATWCGPCKIFKPTFDKIAEEFKGKVEFLSVDVDECPELAKEFGVQYIPQITSIKPNGTKKSDSGVMDEAQFRDYVKNLLK